MHTQKTLISDKMHKKINSENDQTFHTIYITINF